MLAAAADMAAMGRNKRDASQKPPASPTASTARPTPASCQAKACSVCNSRATERPTTMRESRGPRIQASR